MSLAASPVLTGGSGFVGRHFAAALSTGGQGLRILDRLPPRSPLPAGAVWVERRLEKPLPVGLLSACPTVYHLAGLPRFPGHPREAYRRDNLETTRRILEAMDRDGCREIYFLSTMRVYALGEAPVTEACAPAPRDPYGEAKLEAEQEVRAWLQASPDRRAVICRPAALLGPGERGNFSRLIRALRHRRFVYPGRKDTVKSCGWVGDLVLSAEFARRRNRRFFLYNFAWPERITLERIVTALCRLEGRPPPRLVLPGGLVRAASLLGGLLGGSRFGLHPRQIDKLLHSSWIEPRALLDAGFRFPTTLESALEAWYRIEIPGR